MRSQKSPDTYLSAKKLFDKGLRLLEQVISLRMTLIYVACAYSVKLLAPTLFQTCFRNKDLSGYQYETLHCKNRLHAPMYTCMHAGVSSQGEWGAPRIAWIRVQAWIRDE